MKRKMGQKFRRMLTVAMSAIMIVEAVNCASLTALASDGSTVSAGDAINLTEGLKDDVNDAESAAIAADEAAKAAEEALKKANELADDASSAALEVDPVDGTYTETVSDGNGNLVEQPELKDEIDAAITDAEEKVEDSNTANGAIIDATQTEIDGLAAQAKTDTQAKLDTAEAAADKAEAAAQAAQDKLAEAQAATDYYTAAQAAKFAMAEYYKAKSAASEAKKAYEDAQKILDAAVKAVDDAVAACDVSTGDAIAAAQKAIDDAQKAVDDAKAIVDQAAAEFAQAESDLAAAQTAADEAAKIADGLADKTVENLENKTGNDVDKLTAEKEAAEAELEKLQKAKEELLKANQVIINDETTKKDEANRKATELNNATVFNNAKSLVSTMEYTSWKKWTSDIDEARDLAGKTPGSWKVWPFSKYSASEVNSAKETVAKYDAAKKLIEETNKQIQDQRNLAAAAQEKIDSAVNSNNAASNNVTSKEVEIAGKKADIETVTNFIYNNSSADVYDLKDNKEYQKLLKEMEASEDVYDEKVDDREEYQDAITRDWSIRKLEDVQKIWENIMKMCKELNIELTNNQYKFNIDDFSIVKDSNGLTVRWNGNQKNLTTLIRVENEQLTIAKVDEAEFAAYAATYEAVAAAESAAKAADAAAKATEAKNKLQAAQTALQVAQERLNNAKLKKLDLEKAQADLEIAKRNVEATKAEWEAAQKSAEEAKKAADVAKEEPTGKPVKVAYYVLNRSITQPSEIYSYPKSQYSSAIWGELEAGENDVNIPLYNKGIADGTQVDQYLKVVPTTQQLKDAGVTLSGDEYIKWYVIKTHSDGYHVDGIIMNQKFNINVLYGYEDADGNFVEFTKADGTTYAQSGVFGLGESYSFASPVMDFYTALTSEIAGTATKDETYRVVYTQDPVTTVKVNYYRESLNGTLLGSRDMNVAIKNAESFGEVIKANWLNNYRPGDCYDGVLISYVPTSNGYVANVVYGVIPTAAPTPAPIPTPGPTPTEVPEEAVPLTPLNTPAPTPARVNTVTPAAPVVEDAEEPVDIEDEETPLANVTDDNNDDTAPTSGEIVDIEDEETPLAAGQNCWIHWLILLITAAYTFYELVRCIKRNKQIKELSDSKKRVEA